MAIAWSRTAGVDRRHVGHGVSHRLGALPPERGARGRRPRGRPPPRWWRRRGGQRRVRRARAGRSSCGGRVVGCGWTPGWAGLVPRHRARRPEPAGQLRATAGDARPHRAWGDAEGLRDLRVVEVAEIPEHHRCPELLRQLGERVIDGQAVGEEVDRDRRGGAGLAQARCRRAAQPRVAACGAAARRGKRSSPPGTPTWRTRPARRSAGCRGRWRSAPPGWRRARRPRCRPAGGTPRGSGRGDGAAARRARHGRPLGRRAPAPGRRARTGCRRRYSAATAERRTARPPGW